MGAWIEIGTEYRIEEVEVQVAPHMGAWIEITTTAKGSSVSIVAPHMGAWIEIFESYQQLMEPPCRTPHGCVD